MMFGMMARQQPNLCFVPFSITDTLAGELAWLSARCRRQLDKALTHAKKAVALDPKSVAYLDTDLPSASSPLAQAAGAET
jgi:hypothetical protein